MEAYTPVINGALLAVFTFVIAWLGKGRFDAMNRRFDQLETRIGRIESEMAELRTMIMQLAVAVGVQTKPQTG